MNLLNFFQRTRTAPTARDRLQILLAHERVSSSGQSDLIALLREEVLEVIARHVPVDRDKVQVKMERGNGVSMIEIDVEIPNGHGVTRRAVGA
jgi:cell division topological specificity factor